MCRSGVLSPNDNPVRPALRWCLCSRRALQAALPGGGARCLVMVLVLSSASRWRLVRSSRSRGALCGPFALLTARLVCAHWRLACVGYGGCNPDAHHPASLTRANLRARPAGVKSGPACSLRAKSCRPRACSRAPTYTCGSIASDSEPVDDQRFV